MEDYRAIKIKLNDESEFQHHLFFKKHLISKSELNGLNKLNSQTLFVINVPPYYNEQVLKNIFNTFGKVDDVFIHSKPTLNPFKLYMDEEQSYFNEEHENTFKVAYVVFEQNQSIDKALNKSLVDKERLLVNNKESKLNAGIKKWINEYKKSFVDARQLNKEIDSFMLNYDQKKIQVSILSIDFINKEKEIQKSNQPDDDGWITVTTKNRKSNFTFTERNIEKLKLNQKKKRQKMQLLNFYSFQMKESKKEYIAQLRKKFEEDKKRIEFMKQNRKFKPF